MLKLRTGTDHCQIPVCATSVNDKSQPNIPNKNHFVIYNEMDGILPNDFLAKPALVASDGNIYMGGSEGLVRINKALKPASAPPPITLKLQEIALNGTTVHFIPRSTMEIPYNFSSLKIHTQTIRTVRRAPDSSAILQARAA